MYLYIVKLHFTDTKKIFNSLPRRKDVRDARGIASLDGDSHDRHSFFQKADTVMRNFPKYFTKDFPSLQI